MKMKKRPGEDQKEALGLPELRACLCVCDKEREKETYIFTKQIYVSAKETHVYA